MGVALRLFLPAEWTDDPARCRAGCVPEDWLAYRTKLEIALQELDRVRAAGVAFGCVLADAGYGISAEFHHALSARGLTWAVGIPRIQNVYRPDVRTEMPAPRPGVRHGRPRRHPCPVRRRASSANGTLTGTTRAGSGDTAHPSWRRDDQSPRRLASSRHELAASGMAEVELSARGC